MHFTNLFTIKNGILIKPDIHLGGTGFRPNPQSWVKENKIFTDEIGRVKINNISKYSHQTNNPKIFSGGEANSTRSNLKLLASHSKKFNLDFKVICPPNLFRIKSFKLPSLLRLS